MPKGRVLTTAEREQITRLHEGGASAREIAKKLERSKTVVLNFLKNPAQYAQIKRSGRKRALSRDDERRLYAALFETSTHTSQPQTLSAEAPTDAAGVAAVAAAAASVAGAAALNHGDEQLYMPQSQHQPQDVKMSAEQIKKVFNVPLSTRRIQQLLSEWRREARRAQDRQQLCESAGAVPTLPLITAAHATASGASNSLESLAELPPLVESSITAAAISTLAPEPAAAPVAKSEPTDSASGTASPNDLSSTSSSAPATSGVVNSSDEKFSSSTAAVAVAVVDGVEGATAAPASPEGIVAAAIEV